MVRRPPRATRTDTLVPSTTLCRYTGRKALARTSVTPGRTQELNVFDVGTPLAFRLVDMPGYGFAKAPKDVVKKWRYLINDFLRGRAVLKRPLVLIDSRHGFKDVARDVMKMLDDAAVSSRVGITMTDQTQPTAHARAQHAHAADTRKH